MSETNTATLAPTADPAFTDVSLSGDSAESVEDTSYLGALPDIGDTDISEDALRGDSAQSTTATPPESESAPSESVGDEPKKVEEEQTETKDEDVQTAQDGEKPTHPKGYVPLAAVQEARRENASLKASLADLQSQVAQLGKGPEQEQTQPVADADGFKELSAEEFKDLVDDDPPAAILYLNQKAAYDVQQTAVRAAQATEQTQVQQAYTRMVTAIPDLFEEGATSGKELADFASELGFGPELFHLTNPNTRLLVPGEAKPVVLGEGAAAIVEMFAGLQSRLKEQGATEASLRESLTKEIREQVQAELLAKFKNEGPGHQSLASLPGTDSQGAISSSKDLSMAEIAKLSDAELERYLSGA